MFKNALTSYLLRYLEKGLDIGKGKGFMDKGKGFKGADKGKGKGPMMGMPGAMPGQGAMPPMQGGPGLTNSRIDMQFKSLQSQGQEGCELVVQHRYSTIQERDRVRR